ncbi:hypothetical protein [Pannonibacter carbonis]|uniref:hypothetical protein n=1 Tax=Pannonibacter carbonis TaxID=2067569 RepID=UPI0013003808|nr:hypothetical protein [Pannonibacter carbonis]
MGKWKKSFRSLPPRISAEMEKISSPNLKVLAGKEVSQQEVENGVYSHLGLNIDTLEVGKSWEIVPASDCGMRSKRNLDGWVNVRRDLPKFTKYFYHDIAIYGDATRNGMMTVAIPREVYERDEYPPYLFHVEISVKEHLKNGLYGIVFSVDEVFLRGSSSFDEDLFFAVNLLQETTGVSGVVAAENPDFVFSSVLNWEFFPPGNLEAVKTSLCSGNRPISEDTVSERLDLFEQFNPLQYLRGLGGNDYYVGAKYSDDLVVFENLKYGNALYVLYDDWEELSKRPRSELLKLRTSKFDRLVHVQGWETRFAVLMQTNLEARGIRIRVGRNIRRRVR